ncbi:MAG TPA: D-alanine--D-alanine ligase family protein [Bacilli bacterium]|nr:D-alanine--D-alanine ligase family protein [Bacilli bacterium]
MKIKVGVIFGGPTTEHEISIITAVQAMNHFDEEKYDIVPIYITKDRQWYSSNLLKDISTYKDLKLLKKYSKKVTLYNNKGSYVLQSRGLIKQIIDELDIVFPIVHGYNMEDGNIQGYLDVVGVPYVGSDIYGCVVGQDKVFMKQIFESIQLPITKYKWFYDHEYQNNKEEVLNNLKVLKFPVIVKPARLGSSIGIGKAENTNELEEKIETAINYDEKIVVEEIVDNLVELNCSVLGSNETQETSVIEEVSGKDDFLSFEDKYIGNGKKGKIANKTKGILNTDRIIPAKIDNNLKKQIEDMSKKAFKALGAAGVVRIDYLMNKETKELYINELNTVPGSLSFYLWDKKDISYTELLDNLITLAIKRARKKDKKTYSFSSNVLESYNGTKGKFKGKLK